jgi:ATPase inhibitor subunit zeta
MTTFDTREREFEARFKHDQDLQFKITARRNLLLGLWGAQQLGLLGDAAEACTEASRGPVAARRQPERRRQTGCRSGRQRHDVHRGSDPI